MEFSPSQIVFFALSVFGLVSALHAILHKRDPRAAFGWLVTCLVLFGVGPALYWLLGINRIRTHARKLYRLENRGGEWKGGKRRRAYGIPPGRIPSLGRFKGLLSVSERVNRHPLTPGNRLEMLLNGEQAYPRMLGAVDRARESVHLSTFIFDADGVGLRFVEALRRAQSRGVRVRVLVDAFGERYSKVPISRHLKKEGIPWARFLPLSPSINSIHLNLRNHRKLLVVDGKTGFTGGMNITGRHWAGSGKAEQTITDVHFGVEGPVVRELQEVFLEDWNFATGRSLKGPAPSHSAFPGKSVCRAVSGGPNEDFEKINWILLGAMAWARRRVQIMTPYFVPDRVMISALNTAALRGLSVEVLLPEKNNLPFVAWASRALFWEMLQNGVRFYYRPPPFAHDKLFIADDAFALIGSSNWDARSLRLNFELDLEIYDPVFVGTLSGYFDRIRDAAREVTFQEVRRDPTLVRFRNSFFKLFSPYL